MFVGYVEEVDLHAALEAIQPRFDHNLMVYGIRPTICQGMKGFLLTLGTKTKGGKGSRRTGRGAPTTRACWHVIGSFIDALPAQAQVFTGGQWTMPGYKWIDMYTLVKYKPVHYLTLCDCRVRSTKRRVHAPYSDVY